MKLTIRLIFLGVLGLSLNASSGVDLPKEENQKSIDEKVPQNTSKIEPSFSPIDDKLPEWLPQVIGQDSLTMLKQPKILGDILKLKWSRIVQVGSALFGLGLVILLKMFLLWIVPLLSSAPVKAVQRAVAQEASRQLVSDVVMKAVSTLQGLYG